MIRKPSWRESLAVYLEPRVLILFAMGFSSGLPLLLVFGTLSYWLREADVSLTDIGYMSWVALAYGFKWLWSPLVDRMPLPLLSTLLGRRRSWMLFSQLLIAGALVGMAFCDPKSGLTQLALFALLVAFASATQDIVIDAYRIESAPERLQAAMAASYMTGYRLAMIIAGAGALALAAWFGSNSGYDYHGWQVTYLLMAALMSLGVITTLLCHEPEIDLAGQSQQQGERKALLLARGWPAPLASAGAWGYEAVWSPFADFFRRYGHSAMLILALIACYRVADVVMGVMSNSFYVDMQFSKTEVATITKVFGVIMTLVGAAVGGAGDAVWHIAHFVSWRAAHCQYQPAVRAAPPGRPQSGAADADHFPRQPQRRYRDCCVCHLSLESYQCRLFGDPVRPVQLGDVAVAQTAGRFFRTNCGADWLQCLLCRNQFIGFACVVVDCAGSQKGECVALSG